MNNLQIPSSLIDLFSQSVILFLQIFKTLHLTADTWHYTSTVRARDWKLWHYGHQAQRVMWHMSCVTFQVSGVRIQLSVFSIQVSGVTCQVSHVTSKFETVKAIHILHVMCHMSCVTIIFIFITYFFQQIGGAISWTVCYQLGLTRLVMFVIY